MKAIAHTVRFFALSAFIITSISCVSDVDFDQADEIVITPQLDADLIFLTLTAADFEGADENQEMAIVRDTTRLEFLNDDVTQENLKEIEFTFKVENTFGQSLVNRSQFLNNDGVLQYEFMFDIPPSIDGQPVAMTLVETLNEQEIDAVRNSIQVVSEVEVQVNSAPIAGELNIQSKALYSLEFTDF